MLIATITLNPSIDRTLEIQHLVVGGMNRVIRKTDHPSGKGINVTRTLSDWGQPSEALALVGGASGDWLVEGLRQQGIKVDYVKVQGDTRINLKIWDASKKRSTEVNEPGPKVTTEELEELKSRVARNASGWDWLVISGSVPPGTPPDFYANLVDIARSQGAKVALDASGAALREGVKAIPDLIKPNEVEAAELLGWEPQDETEAIEAVEELAQSGIRYVLLTLGKAGAFVGYGGQIWQGIPPEIEARSTVGCGDSAVAGMVWALKEGKDLSEAMCWAMAAGAAAATTWGTEPADWETVVRLVDQVKVYRHR